MSQENVGIVRGAFEAYKNGGVSAIVEQLSQDFELTLHPPTPQASFHGPEGLIEFSKEWDRIFDEVSLTPERFFGAGDQVLVLLRFGGRGKGSDVPVDVPVAHIWTVRQGKVVRAAFYTDRAEALEAAGLSE